VPRVVWNRPKMGHRGPVRRSTHIDEIPFLAVARSLGDLWSYNSEEDVFVVSPEPDTYVYPIDIARHRCLVLGTDGAWNMLTPSQAVRVVAEAERSNEQHMLNPTATRQWINPSKRLVDKAIEKWNGNNLRADNTSVVTVMLDPPGPPRAQVLKRQRELAQQMSGSNQTASGVINADRGSVALVTNASPEDGPAPAQVSAPLAAPRPPVAAFARPAPPHVHPYPYAAQAGASSSATLSQPPIEAPGSVSIVSRFPNAAALERRRRQDEADQQMPDVDPLPRLSTAAAAVVDSTSGHGRKKSQPASSSAQPSSSSSTPGDDIQCNVVSSSDDDTPARKERPRAKKATSRLSRELSALQLDSPRSRGRLSRVRRTPVSKAKAKHATTSRMPPAEDSGSSDVENEGGNTAGMGRQLRSNRACGGGGQGENVECQNLGTKLKAMERNMTKKAKQFSHEMSKLHSSLVQHNKEPPKACHPSKSASSLAVSPGQPRALRSNQLAAGRSLRPRTPAKAASMSVLTPRKRKAVTLALPPVAKSPKTSSAAVAAVTRSRTAKVLQLRKQ